MFLTHFREISNIKFYGNLSCGSRVIPGGWTDTTKLTVAFRSFVHTPKKANIYWTFSQKGHYFCSPN